MTDSTGLIQHAIYDIPRRDSGYCTDDNARALRLCTRMWQHRPDEHMLDRVATYLGFVQHARCPGRGFHNFMSYDRHWLDAEGCGDCQGQTLRALGEVLGSDLPEGYRLLARELIDAVLPALADLRSLRTGLRDSGLGTPVDGGRQGSRSFGERGVVGVEETCGVP